MAKRGIKIGIHNGPAVNFDLGVVKNNKIFIPRTTINKEMVCVRLHVEAKRKGKKNKNKSYKSDKAHVEMRANILDDDLISDASSIDDDDHDTDGGKTNQTTKRVSKDDLGKPTYIIGSSVKHTVNRKYYTLYVVRNKLWQIDVPLKRMRILNKEFEVIATEMFPLSFLWLLRECARMISVPIRELYKEVLSFENVTADFGKQHKHSNINSK